MYIIQASPYSKLWTREYHKQCEANPELVNSVDEFQIVIPRSAGAITLVHNRPVHTSKLMPRSKEQKRDEHCPLEEVTLVEWLTGGEDGMRSNETDIYGVVGIDLDADLSAAAVSLFSATSDNDPAAAKRDAESEFKDLLKKVKIDAKSKMVEARALADKRVLRALKTTHRNLMKQYETMKQEGKGAYSPSVAEMVGAFILRDELNAANKASQGMRDGFSKILRDSVISS